MRKLLISALLTISLVSCTFAQARINSTFAQLKEEFKYGYNMIIDEGNDGGIFMVVTLADREVMYMFDDKMYCFITIIMPTRQGTIQSIIEDYNQKYVIISPTRWRFYNNGLYSDITFENLSDTDAFVWRRGD